LFFWNRICSEKYSEKIHTNKNFSEQLNSKRFSEKFLEEKNFQGNFPESHPNYEGMSQGVYRTSPWDMPSKIYNFGAKSFFKRFNFVSILVFSFFLISMLVIVV